MGLSNLSTREVQIYAAEVTMPTTSGTVEAFSLPAGSVVLTAGATVVEAAAGSTAHAFDLSVGAADVVTALDFQAASVDDVLTEAATPVAVSAADTLDVVSTITGTGTAGKAYVWAAVLYVGPEAPADEVARDQLA